MSSLEARWTPIWTPSRPDCTWKIDDLRKAAPEWAPARPAVGIAPKLSDAELVTLAVVQALCGFTSEARWLRHARARLRYLFPYLPQQPGYNKRLRAGAGLVLRVIRALAADTTLCTDDGWVVDSTRVECGRSRRRQGQVAIRVKRRRSRARGRSGTVGMRACERRCAGERMYAVKLCWLSHQETIR